MGRDVKNIEPKYVITPKINLAQLLLYLSKKNRTANEDSLRNRHLRRSSC